MASRKVADAHVMFSAKGLDKVAKDAQSVIDHLVATGQGGSAVQTGPFTKGLLRDIALMKDMNRAVSSLIAQQRELSRSAPTTSNVASNIRSAMSGDRESQLSRSRAFSRQQLSSRGQDAAAVSPTLLSANQKASQNQRDTLRKMQASLASFGNSDQFSAKNGKKATQSQRYANFAGRILKGSEVGNTPDEMRGTSQKLKNFAERDLGFKPSGDLKAFISKIKTMASELDKAAQKADEYAAALKRSKSLTPDEKSGIRGNLRDIDGAEQRRESTLNRQKKRDFLAADPAEVMGRRLGEIDSNKELSSIGKSQEITLASQKIAEALRTAATGVREAGIDKAIEKAARDLKRGAISKEEFRDKVARSGAERRGATSAEETLREADFRSRKDGQNENEISDQAEVGELKKRSDKIQELIDKNEGLTEKEKERLTTEKKLLDNTVTLKSAEFKLTQEMKKHEDEIRKVSAERSDLLIKQAKGSKLTKDEKRELKGYNKQLDVEYVALQKLKTAHAGVNQNLKEGSRASRNYNFKLQQASYGVQDFVQVIGQTGLSGALRASANNMASFFAASGTPTGAIIGAVGTIAMIGLADAFAAAGDSADSAEKKVEKLRRSVERFFETKKESNAFTGSLLSDPLGQGGFSAQSGIATGQSISEGAGGSSESANSVLGLASQVAADAQGFFGNLNTTVEESIAGIVLTGGSPERIEQAVNEAIFRSGMNSNEGTTAEDRKKEEDELRRIGSLSSSDPSQAAELALILDPSNEDLQKALQEFNDQEAKLVALFGRLHQSFLRLDESLSTMESNVADVSDFDGRFAQEQADALAKAISASARRIEIESERAANTTDPTERATRERLVEEEEKVFNRYIESLERINGELSTARVGNGLSNSMSAMVGAFTSARRRLEESLSGATPGQRQAILAGFDDSQMNQLTQSFGDGILAFTGDVQRNLFETQAEANQRAIDSWRSLIEEIRNNGIAADDSLIPAIEIAIGKIKEGEGGAQERTSVTGIGGLHQKIQESLRNDPDLDLQKSQRDLLIQIRDKIGSKPPEFDFGAPVGADVVEIFGDDAQSPAAAWSPPRQTNADLLGPSSTPEGFIPTPGQSFNEGNFNVPPPRFNYDQTFGGKLSPSEPGKLDLGPKPPPMATNGPWTPAVPPMPEDPQHPRPPAPPIPTGPTDRDRVKYALEIDPTLNQVKEDLRKTQATYIDLSGARKEREQDANTKLKVDSQKDLSSRNMRAIEGRNTTGNSFDNSEAASMFRAGNKVMEAGYSDIRNGEEKGADAFYGTRRGGTVGDQATRKHAFTDDFPGGRRGKQLTESQQQTISSPASALAVPGESPDENRRRRVAERNAAFGERPDAGPEMNGKRDEYGNQSTDFDWAMRALPNNTMWDKAGRNSTLVEGSSGDRLLADSSNGFNTMFNKMPVATSRQAGPQITGDNVREKMAPINPGNFAKMGGSVFARSRGVDSFDDASIEAEESGIPLSTPNQGESRQGLKSQQRRDRILSGRAKADREAREAKADLEEYGPGGQYGDRQKGYKDRAIAENEAKAARESGLSGGAARSRKRREDQGRDPSWMQQNAVKPPAADISAGSPAEVSEVDAVAKKLANRLAEAIKKEVGAPQASLGSNVNTDTKTQAVAANDEAVKFQQNTSNKMDELVELIKSRSSSGGLVIS